MVVKVPKRFDKEGFIVKSSLYGNLATQLPCLIVPARIDCASSLIQPFDDRSSFSEPLTTLFRIVTLEVGYGGYELDSIIRLRERTVKIVFSQFPNQSVPAQDQSQRFNQRRLTSVVVSDKNRVLSEADKS